MKKYILNLLLIPVLACLASLSCYLAPERDNANDYVNGGVPVPAIQYTFENDTTSGFDKIIKDSGNAGYNLNGSIDDLLISYHDGSVIQNQSKSIYLIESTSCIDITSADYPINFDSGNFSIVIIAKNVGPAPWGALISKIGGMTAANIGGWCIRLDSAMEELILEDGEHTGVTEIATIDTSGIFDTESWHVIAATFDNTNKKWYVYLDNLSNSGDAVNYETGEASLTIGHTDKLLEYGQRDGFAGTMKIDAVMIYDHVLQTSQIEAIYTSL